MVAQQSCDSRNFCFCQSKSKDLKTKNNVTLATGIKTVVDNKHLPALIQSQQSSDDDLMGAPAAAVESLMGAPADESKAGGIIDALMDLMEKAESELSDVEKAESSANYSFLQIFSRVDLQNSEADALATNLAKTALATVGTDCMPVVTDYEAAVAQEGIPCALRPSLQVGYCASDIISKCGVGLAKSNKEGLLA